jgi:hypothetical protein
MAEQEKKRAQEAFGQVWDLLFELSHKEEMQAFDFKARSFEWQSDNVSRMICRHQTAEGRIWLAEDKLFWKTCVKRECHVGKSHHFIKFVEAVDWVEKEIVNLANSPDAKKEEGILSEEKIKANRIRLINAARMEPKRITYKSFETICGGTYKFADRYPTSGKLASDIHLDASYQGTVELHSNCQTPFKKSKHHPLAKREKQKNCALAQRRILIELIFCKLKVFRILSERYRNRRKRFALRFNLISAIYNLELNSL